MKKNNPLITLGEQITKIRENQLMTQAELAEKIGTTQSVVARIEKGEQNLSTETLSKISKALNHPVITLAPQGTVNFRIEGGHKLSGKIKVRTSKNGAVGVLTASLLNKGKTVIKNAPRIEEVYRIIEVLESIGVRTEWKEAKVGNEMDLYITPPKKIEIEKIDKDSAGKTRSAMMIMGSLIHDLPKFRLPQTGGCRLGSRTVKPFLYAFEKIGANIDTKSEYFEIQSKSLKPAEIVLYETGDVVTETILMAAAKISGKTTIKFASSNYQVQDVCFYLEKLGVRIEGIGTSTLTVHGIEEINKDVEYYLSEDPIEAMSLITIAVVTKSAITIERCPIDFLELELLKLEKMGFKYEIVNRYKAHNGQTNLVDIKTFPSNLVALEDKIHAMPYPGLNIDNLPFFAAIGLVAEGQTFIHDWTYEERMIHLSELNKLRAETILADPHRFYVKGPAKLRSAEVISPPALRPSVVIMIAMMIADGTSILRNVYNINRGYEDLADRLNSIGAKIETFRDL